MVLLFIFPSHSFAQQIQLISADLTVKKLEKGTSFTQTATLLYRSNGALISHFHPPVEHIVLNNSNGNIRLYNVKKNEVTVLNEPFLGSNTTYFYFFVNRKMADLGLSDYGFTLYDSQFEAPYQITWWVPPAELLSQLSKVKLVHKEGRIVFAGYHHPKAGLFKKVYYSGGEYILGSFFPEKITTITYIDQGQDSVIERSVFSEIKVNAAANTLDMEFEIPSDASVVE